MLLQPSCAFQSFLTVKFLLKEPSPEAGELFRVELLPDCVPHLWGPPQGAWTWGWPSCPGAFERV